MKQCPVIKELKKLIKAKRRDVICDIDLTCLVKELAKKDCEHICLKQKIKI